MLSGLYLHGDSVIHKMNAVTKLIAFLALLVMVIACGSVPGFLLALAALGGIAFLAGVPVRIALGHIRQMWLFFVIIFLMNTCFFAPEQAWVQIGFLYPSRAGMLQGVQVVGRVILTLILSNLLIATTPPLAITNAFAKLIAPLGYIGVPTRQIAMILSVSIQFIPTLFEEAQMILRAQTARGAGFEATGIRARAGAVLPLVVPVFLSAFKRADELSLAMEARGYRIANKKTTKAKGLKTGPNFQLHDYAAIILSLTLCMSQLML